MFSALKLFTVANLLTAHLFINTVKKKKTTIVLLHSHIDSTTVSLETYPFR